MGAKIGEFRIVPGPESRKIIEKNKRYLATTTNNSVLAIEKTYNCNVRDPDGHTYIDFTSGVGCANIGHSNAEVARIIYDQYLENAQFIITDFHNWLPGDVAEKLANITPGKFPKKVFFCNSGAEAVEAAVKLVMSYHPAHKNSEFIAFQGAFHGRTGYALTLTDSGQRPERKEHFPEAFPVHRYIFPKITLSQENLTWIYEHLKEDFKWGGVLSNGRIAAVIFEPIQGEGGINAPDGEILRKIVDLCRSNDAIIIADEVQTGFGRTGKMFACEHFDIEPDVICLAKAFGMGVPAGAIVFRADLDWDRLGRHSNTNGGNNIAMAAALKGIEIIENHKLVENAAAMGDVLRDCLIKVKETYSHYILEVRGLGLMQAVEFINRELRNMIVTEALNLGLVLIGAGHSSIRFLPPLIIAESQIMLAMDIFNQAVDLGVQKYTK